MGIYFPLVKCRSLELTSGLASGLKAIFLAECSHHSSSYHIPIPGRKEERWTQSPFKGTVLESLPKNLFISPWPEFG